jgi:hypothetical protein
MRTMHCPICDHQMQRLGHGYVCMNVDCEDMHLQTDDDIEVAEEIDLKTKHHISDYL